MPSSANASVLTDVLGNLAVGTFGSAQSIASGSKPAGIAIGGLNSSNLLTPLSLDPYGALTIRPGVCPTYTATSQSVVTTGTTGGKPLMSVMNNSTAMWLRVAALYAQCPPQTNVSGGLLGTSTTYTQVIFGAYRITGHSGGTQLAFVSADPADDGTLDANVTVRTAATLAGKAVTPSYCWDAAYNASLPVGPRPDLCMKVWTLPPGGNGLAFVNMNNLPASVGFLMTLSLAQNIA